MFANCHGNCHIDTYLSHIIEVPKMWNSFMDAKEEAHLSSCMWGYHVYNTSWTVIVGEEFYVQECKGRICYLRLVRFKCTQMISNLFLLWGWNIMWHIFITRLIWHRFNYCKKSKCENKVHAIKTSYLVSGFIDKSNIWWFVQNTMLLPF